MYLMSGYSCKRVLGVLGSHKLELFEMKGVFLCPDVCGKEIVCGSEGFEGAFCVFGTKSPP